jgi:hypothetical protein
MAAAEQCLELDRRMAGRAEFAKPIPDARPPAEAVDDYLPPSVWEHYVEARRELVDFTTASIEVLARDRPAGGQAGGPAPDEQEEAERERSDIERRLVNSLTEMVELESRLAAYLTENLEALDRTIDGLTRNQTLFTKYARRATKPDPCQISSQG